MNLKKLKSLLSAIIILCYLNLGIHNSYALTPNDINNKVFHYDIQDIDGDGSSANNPNIGDSIQTITDKFNDFDAYQNDVNKQAIFNNGVNNLPSINFDGINDIYNIDDNTEIASGSGYKEKTFAIVFSTSDDITSLQTIYEQGGKEKGYAIQIENSKLYAGVWNSIDWTVGNRYKVADLGDIEINTTYDLIISQNSNTENNLKVYSKSKLVNSIMNVDEQTTHGACTIPGAFSCYIFDNGGSVGLGATKNDTLKLSDETEISGFETNHFKGNIGEMISWNKYLTQIEATGLFKYLDDKWLLVEPEITINIPQNVGVIQAGNFQIDINYNDFQNGQGINTSSDIVEIYKWNGVSWGVDISNSLINLNNKNIDSFSASYPVVGITQGKYKLVYKISKTSGIEATKERLFHVGEILPDDLPNIIFQYDAQDVNGDGDLNNNPINGSSVTTLVDKINSYNASQGTISATPILQENTINGYSSLNFDGNDFYNISNQTAINTSSTYNEKSFAAVFKTGNDVNTFQNIYEQGGNVRGYSFVIDNGHVYAGVWNINEWDNGHQYKSVDLGVAQPNTVYFAMIVQDSKTNIDTENTLKIYLNGNLSSFQDHVDPQVNHPGGISIGRVNGNTISASDNTVVNAGNFFNGNIGELISWNYALDQADINGVQEYFSNKWGVVNFSEITAIPSPTSDRTPNYKFYTNKSGTLSYNGSCNSTYTSAINGINNINLDIDGSGGNLTDGLYNDCSITLTDENGYDHVLNITPFTVEGASFTLNEVTPINSPNNDNTPNYTFYSPINGNIEYYGSCSSNNTYTNIGNNTITLDYLNDGIYSDCFLKVKNATQESEFLNLSSFEIITDTVSITNTSLINDSLFPTGEFNFNYQYNGPVNTSSSNIELYKYDSVNSIWGTNDLSNTYINQDSINSSQVNYSTIGIPYGKYQIIFNIANNSGNYSNIVNTIYIDEPEFIISNSSIELGNLEVNNNKYSPDITLTVKTLGAGFNIYMKQNSSLTSGIYEIADWNGVNGYGYEKTPYLNTINMINNVEMIQTTNSSINTSGEKNTYIYTIKLGANISEEQEAGVYNSDLLFGIQLDY